MHIRQISVYLSNVSGSLYELTQLLGEHGINLLALSLADTERFGIARLIVKSGQFDQAHALLEENGFTAKVNHVLCVSIPDRPLALAGVLAHIKEADISVEYMYSFCRTVGSDALLIIRPASASACAPVLEAAGVHLLSQEEVDQMF